ncbi:MAG: aspartate kinase [Gemmatimonadota bacterium]|nr:aspartate kinase [Gemmatimonadota bacterium]
MGTVVCKFGGSSLADDRQMAQVKRIVESDARRRLIVPSAPGKRNDEDTKITDLLYLCHELARQNLDFSEPYAIVRARYEELAARLGISLDIGRLLDELKTNIDNGASRDFVASRGEYLCGQLISDYMGATFIDAADAIRFRADGELDPASYRLIRERVDSSGMYVVPGFYGSDPGGAARTFSRGGSDITGAIVARAVDAEVYENWTDVSGLLMADPRLVPDARPVREITYREVRELAYMGASVFHDEAMFPVRAAGIPIHIRNTNRPGDPGTRILASRELTDDLIAGVAGQPAFTMLFIEKAMMNQQKGFGRQVLEVVASHDISYEHTPSGIDTMSVIMRDDQLGGKGERLVDDIQRVLQPDRVELLQGLALIATVGEGMSHRIGIAARLFTALADARVNVRVIDQGASEINIIVGVEEADYKRAVSAIYDAFVN